jgi:hypothetical protein
MDRNTRKNIETTRSAVKRFIWPMKDTTRIRMKLGLVSHASIHHIQSSLTPGKIGLNHLELKACAFAKPSNNAVANPKTTNFISNNRMIAESR